MRLSIIYAIVIGATSAACTGDDSGAPPATDSGVDATKDTGVTVDTGTPVDSSSPSDAAEAGGPNCSAAGSTFQQCQACCAGAYPSGAQTFTGYVFSCACAAQYCGPLDGGTGDGGAADAGDAATSDASATDGGGLYGNGACTATCSTGAAPNGTCTACAANTVTPATGGECLPGVIGKCNHDSACQPYFACVAQCPQ